MFTLVPLSEAEAALAAHEVRARSPVDYPYMYANMLCQTNKEARSAQQILAQEVTELVHGSEFPPTCLTMLFDLNQIVSEPAMLKAQIASKVLYESDYSTVKTEDILESLAGDSRLRIIPREELLGTPIPKLAVQAKLVSSNCAYSYTHINSSYLIWI